MAGAPGGRCSRSPPIMWWPLTCRAGEVLGAGRPAATSRAAGAGRAGVAGRAHRAGGAAASTSCSPGRRATDGGVPVAGRSSAGEHPRVVRARRWRSDLRRVRGRRRIVLLGRGRARAARAQRRGRRPSGAIAASRGAGRRRAERRRARRARRSPRSRRPTRRRCERSSRPASRPSRRGLSPPDPRRAPARQVNVGQRHATAAADLGVPRSRTTRGGRGDSTMDDPSGDPAASSPSELRPSAQSFSRTTSPLPFTRAGTGSSEIRTRNEPVVFWPLAGTALPCRPGETE